MQSYQKILSILFIACILNACNTPNNSSTDKAGMWSNAPAERWQDGLLSGNGTMGIIVEGAPEQERITFNHEKCYEYTGTEEEATPKLVKYMPEIKRILNEGKYREAAMYSTKMAEKEGWKFVWTDPYHPALYMTIDQDVIGEKKDYSRKTNFETGEIEVNWTDDKGTFQRKSFVSRPDKVVVQQLSGDALISCKIKISDLIDRKKISKKLINSELLIKEPELEISSDWVTYRAGYTVYTRGYESGTKIIVEGGSSKTVGDEIVIDGASKVLMLTRINFLEDFSKSQLAETKSDIDKLGTNYNTLLSKHAAIHGEIFNRVKFNIFNGVTKSSEELIAGQKSHKDSIDPAFLETIFNMGRYTLISSSGQLPPNLTGIWQGGFRPAWCGDFTLDANVNLQIAGANLGNMKEAIDAYMNLLERIAPDWETNAQNLYGCEGYFAGARTSGRRGLANHFTDIGTWQFWTSGAEWLLLPAYEYYQISGDEEFLRERLLPMMKKTVQFYEGFLTDYDENGNYLFIPSASPENAPANSKMSCASINATIDIAAAKEAIVNLITVCNELNIEQVNIPKWEAMLKKIPPYLISEKGAIKEWSTEKLIENQAHRHISHLYPIWPGLEVNQQETPELFEAAKKAIRIREMGNGSAHGLVHRAFICSRLKMDEEVYDCMKYLFSEGYFYRSLHSAHNAGPATYNADFINSFPAVIMESLVYSRPGVIELLPAWSPKLSKGKISGVKCRTNATVDFLEWDFDKLMINATISSGKNQTINVSYKRGIDKVTSSSKYQRNSENAISFKIKKGEKISFELVMKPTIIITPIESEIHIDSILQLKTLDLPNEKETVLTYASSNNDIATVDNEGRVKGIKEGKVEVVATTNNGKTGKSSITISKYIRPAKIVFTDKKNIITYSKNGKDLIVNCNYQTEDGKVVCKDGVQFLLKELDSGWGTINYYETTDKNTTGTTKGNAIGKFSLKNITASNKLPNNHFYFLMVILEDENGNSVDINKVRLKIE